MVEIKKILIITHSHVITMIWEETEAKPGEAIVRAELTLRRCLLQVLCIVLRIMERRF